MSGSDDDRFDEHDPTVARGGGDAPAGDEADKEAAAHTSEHYDAHPTHASDPAEPGSVHPTTAAKSFRPARFTQLFGEGDVVAGRYTVVRFLARGGMGEVYEVEDRELGERVALKTILPRIAANPVALERFRREILLARKVTHPNVCRIFDIGRHVAFGSDGQVDEVTFLTMELLHGESLSKRLRREELTPEEALPLVRQVASGLASAHRAGVVHRDLKPANIFLVPDEGGLRAVVTDFGLARFEAAGEALAEVTGTGELLGTPAYMSPEQLEGKKPTPASDIYALGLVMYEMLTGARAFEGDTAFQMALRRLQEPPTLPSKHLPDIDPRWERTILRCLEKDPEDRFASADELSEVLGGTVALPTGIGSAALERRLRSAGRSPWLWAAVAVLAIGLGWLSYGLLRQLGSEGGQGGAGSTVTARKSVAVLGFENVTREADAAWISTALSEILTTELAAGGTVRTVPGETVARARADLEIAQMQTLGSETLEALRTNLGTDYVVLGSYTKAGEQLRLDVRLQDVFQKEPEVTSTQSGSADELFAMADLVAAELRGKLGVTAAAEAGTVLAALPADPKAARLYSEGVAKLRSFEHREATELLLQAAEADPSSPLVYSQLASAWSDIGYQHRAEEAARRAYELSSELGTEDRLWIKGQYMRFARNWEEAVRSFGSLRDFHPDNLDYGLQLAKAQTAAGRGDEALETVAALRRLPSPAAEDPRIDITEASAQNALGNPDGQLEAARRAIASARERGARLLVAEARISEASALISRGSVDDAVAACEEALGLFGAADNQQGVASAIERLALVAYYQRDFEQAESRFGEALDISRQIGNRESEANNLNSLGGLHLSRGDIEGATAHFQDALEIFTEIDSSEGKAKTLNNIAITLQNEGDLTGAIDRYRQVLALERERGNQMGEARALVNAAGVLAARGDLEGSRRSYEEGVGVYREIGSTGEMASSLYWLGEVVLWQGDLEAARRQHEEALELRQAAGDDDRVALSELALAGVSLQQALVGEVSAAAVVEELVGVVSRLREKQWPTEEAAALNSLAEAQLEAGDAAAARQSLERASELAPQESDIATRLSLAMTEAAVNAAEGDFDAAVGRLEDVLAEAKRASLLGTELEARLALGEIELAAGRSDAGRRRLEELRQEATARGWILVADKAARRLQRAGEAAAG